jgi:hypothetical protein
MLFKEEFPSFCLLYFVFARNAFYEPADCKLYKQQRTLLISKLISLTNDAANI